jgi:hypothetical protein
MGKLLMHRKAETAGDERCCSQDREQDGKGNSAGSVRARLALQRVGGQVVNIFRIKLMTSNKYKHIKNTIRIYVNNEYF